MKFQLHLVLKDFSGSGLMLILLGKLLLYLTKTLKFLKFPLVKALCFVAFKLTNVNGEHIKYIIALVKTIYLLHCSKRNKYLKNQCFVFSDSEISLVFPFAKFNSCKI